MLTFEGDSKGLFLAKVVNTRYKAAYIDYSGKLVSFDKDQNIIVSKDYVHSYPSDIKLESDEYAYVKEQLFENELKVN